MEPCTRHPWPINQCEGPNWRERFGTEAAREVYHEALMRWPPNSEWIGVQMRDRADHYAEADRLLEEVKDPGVVWADGARERMLSAAMTHALLAAVPADVVTKVFVADKAQHIQEAVDGR